MARDVSVRSFRRPGEILDVGHRARLGAAIALGLTLAWSNVLSSVPAVSSTDPATDSASLERLVGQKLIVRMEGTTPSTGLLGRIGRGEIGGVILFGSNISTPAALILLARDLQRAATDGGQPPLLIAVDQEGGRVRRISWAPPTMSARQMGADGRTQTALTQGQRTGAALADLGINVDLAPVADVPSSTSSFMYLAKRTFGFRARKVARLAGAFATGLESGGVLPAIKHFPGIGRAKSNTDSNVVTIRASRTSLETDLLPFRRAIANDFAIIMLSNATYTAFDANNAAGWSPTIVNHLLRAQLGFTGVTMTDSLSGTAKARGLLGRQLAVLAARAGTDMILLTGSEAATARAHDHLLAEARAGTIEEATLRASFDRILALKSGL